MPSPLRLPPCPHPHAHGHARYVASSHRAPCVTRSPVFYSCVAPTVPSQPAFCAFHGRASLNAVICLYGTAKFKRLNAQDSKGQGGRHGFLMSRTDSGRRDIRYTFAVRGIKKCCDTPATTPCHLLSALCTIIMRVIKGNGVSTALKGFARPCATAGDRCYDGSFGIGVADFLT